MVYADRCEWKDFVNTVVLTLKELSLKLIGTVYTDCSSPVLLTRNILRLSSYLVHQVQISVYSLNKSPMLFSR